MKYFKIEDFDSPDMKGSGSRMDGKFLQRLDYARYLAGIPFVINSGYRTRKHNDKVGGSPNSSHTRGYAVDIHCTDSVSRSKILDALKAAGFTRIGIAKTFIHVDNDPDKAPNVVWLY